MTPQFALQVCGWLIGVPLQIMLIAALLRGSYKRFPFLFIYCVAGIITTAIEIPANVRWVITQDTEVYRHFARIYWYNEWVMRGLVLAVVISLLIMATAQARSRRTLRALSIGGTLLFAAISFAVEFQPDSPKIGPWMTPWTRDLNFGAAILDLILWAMLLTPRKLDSRLLLISGALGVQFAGEAIGFAISKLAIADTISWVSITGSVVTMLADLSCLYVWWRTFKTPDTSQAV